MIEITQRGKFVATQILGLAAVVLLLLATMEDRKHSSKRTLEDPVANGFLWHPLLLSLGMTYFFGLSSVIFRVFSPKRKTLAKTIHTWTHAGAIGLSVAGLVLGYRVRDEWKEDHFGTLHGLLGLLTVVLFGLQWLLSVPVFLWPIAPLKFRLNSMPVHVALGVAVFVSANVSMFTGFAEKVGKTSTSIAYYKASAFFHLFYTLAILYAMLTRRPKYVPRANPTTT